MYSAFSTNGAVKVYVLEKIDPREIPYFPDLPSNNPPRPEITEDEDYGFPEIKKKKKEDPKNKRPWESPIHEVKIETILKCSS